MTHLAFLFIFGFSSFVWGAGLSCETEDGHIIELEHSIPMPERAVRPLKFRIRQHNGLVLEKAHHEIQVFREGRTFNYVVKLKQEGTPLVIALEIEYNRWKDHLAERESVQAKMLLRGAGNWASSGARCVGKPIRWKIQS